MTKLGLLFLAMLCGGPAMADIVAVRAGDHPSFARLVLSVPPGRDWRIGRNLTGYVFDPGSPSDSFDMSGVFDRIRRNRIADLDTTTSTGQLGIVLGCACHAVAFQWRPDKVVVDIVEGPAPAGSAFETALDRASRMDLPPSDAILAQAAGAAMLAGDDSGLGAFALDPAADTAAIALQVPPLLLPLVMPGLTLPGLAMVPADPAEAEVPASTDLAVAPTEQITDTERAIIESFARAASQGLLDLSVTRPDVTDPQDAAVMQPLDDMHLPPPEGPAQAADPMIADMPHANPEPSGLADFALDDNDLGQPGLTYRTSVDHDSPVEIPDVGETASGACLDDSLLDMEGWGDDRDFSAQISEKLSALTTEFDVYPDGAVDALARNYVYFGFGREAIQAFALDATDSQQRRVMVAMAHVVDEEPDPSGLFESQLGCASQAAVWTALSRGTLQGTSEAERVAASAGFRTLPAMLRGHLGARLAQLFVDVGDPETAASLLEAARDQVTADRLETDLAAADIAGATQGPEAAIEALDAIAAEDLRLTPEALVELMNLTLDEGHLLDPELISLADSMVYEHRGEPVAATLIGAQARALVAGHAYAAAFALLDGDVAPMTAETRAALRAAAILGVTEHTDDAAFLNFAFDDLPGSGSAKAENAVAARLMALGFADRAAAILTSPATGAAARDRRYLQAEAALALGDFAAVEAMLGGISDPRAADIRARSLAAQGDFAAASSTEQALPGAVPDPSEAWRAGEWSVLEQSDDPLLRAASDAVLAPPATIDPAAPLASSRALLDDATATQDLAGQLLDRFAIDPADPPPATN